jgi:hypothetical protein
MVMGPAGLGKALGKTVGAGAAAVAVFVVMTNELYCPRRELQVPFENLPVGPDSRLGVYRTLRSQFHRWRCGNSQMATSIAVIRNIVRRPTASLLQCAHAECSLLFGVAIGINLLAMLRHSRCLHDR